MMDFFMLMTAPLVACLFLAVLFTYFGVHVLKREIVFVDLSLAQLAALGTTVAFVLEMDLDSLSALGLSLAFILAGSAFFTYTRTLADRVPQEAIIGIVYVVGSSAALLMVNRAPHGAEHIKNLLNGSILWVGWPGVFKILGVAVLVSFLHWIYRDRFLKQSETYLVEKGGRDSGRVWDFLFYATLGLVIVVSVKTAGIFLVFTLLIIPAVCGALFTRSLIHQFLIGGFIGVNVSLVGLVLSYLADLPTGATLVCSFGLVFILVLFVSRFKTA